jgi:hypothetical protein
LIGIGRGLLGVTPRLLGIREGLVTISAPLLLSQLLHCGPIPLLPLGFSSGGRETIARRLYGHGGFFT